MNMTKETIDRILELAPVQELVFEGRKYTSKAITPVKQPVVSAFTVHTLSGLADYLIQNPDQIGLETVIVHVKSCDEVSVFSELADEWQQRHCYVTATTKPATFSFGHYMPVENFIVALQTYFVPSTMIDDMTRVVGNLSADTSVRVVDDGISQEVQARTGIARVGDVQLPNPVVLAPYRTFNEIEQPESKFLFRMKKDDRMGVMCGLFEADGGNWELTAIQDIRTWLKNRIGSSNLTFLA